MAFSIWIELLDSLFDRKKDCSISRKTGQNGEGQTYERNREIGKRTDINEVVRTREKACMQCDASVYEIEIWNIKSKGIQSTGRVINGRYSDTRLAFMTFS